MRKTLTKAIPLFGPRHGYTSVALISAIFSGAAFAAEPLEVGVWYDDTGKGAVKIERCGKQLCGKIAWLKEPNGADGKPLFDRNNPDPAQRTRTICGLQVIGAVEAMPEGGWDGGWVYDPKVGKSYSVAITLTSRNTMTVTGYKGMRFLGKSFGWTRAPADLVLCGQAPEQATKGQPGEALPWGKAPATTTAPHKADAAKPKKDAKTEAKAKTEVKPKPKAVEAAQ